MTHKTVHIISHSHWDREWYMPYERHHVRLIELMDSLIQLFEQDPEFRSFHLDGQTIILEDYIQVRPEMKEKLKQLVKEGRFIIGPWYILQDEFLTSSEANIRNLLIGLRDAEEYGAVCKLGYFPDSFGNMGQAPQILQQAGIDTAVFGRGVKPVGFNNEVLGSYESTFSEMNWQSPDGSTVLGILFANWYNNGMEVPTDPSLAEIYWEERLSNVEKFASTSQLLFMNGCDHQPAQMDLTAALQTARKLYPDVQFVHSNFLHYIKSLKTSLPSNISTIQGELRSQQTDGWFTLVNTASARVYIKQANQRGQTLLEKIAEPLAAFALLQGQSYPHHLFTYAWKTLMQNHPHDSICGCSVDEVHQEMMTRFAKSYRVAEEIVEASAQAIGAAIDTAAAFADIDAEAVPFVVFNTTGWSRTGVVSINLEIKRISVSYGNQTQIVASLKALSLESYGVVDAQGHAVAAKIEDLGITFGYELPKDKFRQPYMARAVRLTLQADQVAGLGYKSFAWVKDTDSAIASFESAKSNSTELELENEYLLVRISADGTLQVKDKRNGRVYNGLGAYENVGDIGNEYIFCQPAGDQVLTTYGLPAQITLREQTAIQTVYDIEQHWVIPASGDETLEREICEFVPFLERKAQRSEQTVSLTIKTSVTLEQGAPQIKVKTTFNNLAKDHRIRVLLPTDIVAPVHRADSIFEVAVRDTVPAVEWSNPSNCQHQQAFVNVSDQEGGLTAANLGLNEYEILRDGRGTIAITLLRAVGELGDWGVFHTPEAQCLGEHTFEYTIIPHTGGHGLTESFQAAYQAQIPWTVKQLSLHSGSLPAQHQFVQWSGEALALSTVKISEKSGDIILRWFNMTMNQSALKLDSTPGLNHLYKSNVLEETMSPVPPDNALTVRPAEIVTIGCKIVNCSS